MNCPTCHSKFIHLDCVSEQGDSPLPTEPTEGDCGRCAGCNHWWTIENGTAVPYSPTAEEVALDIAEEENSRQRFYEQQQLGRHFKN